MSSVTLDHRLTAVRRRVRQALVTYGVSWLVAVLLGSLLAACFGDWLVHFDDPMVRVILALAIAGGSVWIAYRHLVAPLSVPLSDTDLALWIEGRYPGFHDSLASSVQFVDGKAAVGSPALQRAVVRQTLERLEALDCGDVVDTREVRKIGALAAGLALAALLAGAGFHQQAGLALRRLAFPFSAPAWPRQTNLRLVSEDLAPLELDPERPLKVARGDALQLFVENATGHLPTRVDLQSRLSDHKLLSEPLQPRTMTDNSGRHREVAVGQLLAIKEDVEFRAVGGDDDQMPWFRLEVIPPPVVEELHVTLMPPAYTNREPEHLPEGVGHVQGLIGTRVELVAQASKPVHSAMLRVKDQGRLAVEVAADGRQLSASFVVREAGVQSWWLELKDEEGFEDAEPPRYEVRGIQDFEPEIYIEQPESDMQVTPDAVVPLKTTAKDDLGVKSVQLVYLLETAAGTQDGAVELFAADDRLPLQAPIDYRWNIGDLHPEPGARIVLHTEATDAFDLTAAFPEGKAPPAHLGRSITRTLTVISREDKSQEIAQRHEGLLNDLDRALKLEQQSHDQVDELLSQLEKTGALRPEDLDALKRTELSQRELAAQLSNPVRGLEKRARDLLQELQDNQINDADAEHRLKRIADELARIGREHLQPIEQDLTRARKLLQAPGAASGKSPDPEPKPPEPGPESAAGRSVPQNVAAPDKAASDQPERRDSSAGGPAAPQRGPADAGQAESATPRAEAAAPPSQGPAGKDQPESERGPGAKSGGGSAKPREARPSDRPEDALRQVAQDQAAVLESLGEMLQDLSQWRGEHDAARELTELIKQQGDLNQRAADLARRTLTKSAESLSPQENADLTKLSERQKKLAEQLEQFESRMQGNAEGLQAESPTAAAALTDAAEQSREEAIAGRMRDAAGEIGENRMGQAVRSQDEILRKLRGLEDTLRQNRESDSEMLIKKFKEAESALQKLRDRQSDLLERMDQAAQNADPAQRAAELEQLRKEQRDVAEETARQARRLARLEARRAQTSAQRAAARMGQAGASLEAGESSEAANQQQEALDDLEQAQRELARQRREEEEQLAREQLARVADDIVAVIARQQSAIEEARRLDGLHSSAGKWTRAQLVSLRDLAGLERSLAEDTGRIAEKLSAAEVFALAIKGAAQRMQRAAGLIEERSTGERTQREQEAARQRLADLVDALQPEPASEQNAQAQEGAAEQQQNPEGPPSEGLPTIAQVKMLISLQKELAARTAELERARGKDGRLPPAAHDELEAIAREQGELADLARNLSALSSQPEGDTDGSSDSEEKLQPEGGELESRTKTGGGT